MSPRGASCSAVWPALVLSHGSALPTSARRRTQHTHTDIQRALRHTRQSIRTHIHVLFIRRVS